MSFIFDLEARSLGQEPRAFYPPCNMTLTDYSNIKRYNEVIERHLPHVLDEKRLQIGQCDKIFASQWLTEDLAIVGTKCNKLLVIDVNTNAVFTIPLLKNSFSPRSTDAAGIHCIEISDDRNYICTGALNPNELAVYKLPEMIPCAVGQGHSDWIFDAVWLTNDIILSGSRDSTMGIWRIKDDSNLGPYCDGDMLFDYPMAESVPQMESLGMFTNSCRRTVSSTKIRSMTINKNLGVLASLQTSVCDATLHLWDCCTFQEQCSVQMPYNSENVCLGVQPEYNLYAVGSRSHISFIDGRINKHSIGSIRSRDKDCGIRSLQFNDNVVSVGSGGGNMFFYDLRLAKYVSIIDTTISFTEELCCLKTTNGWVRRDNTYRDFFSNLPEPPNAIYTHKYSPSKSKMLLAGGPLPLGLYGNYCSLWA